MNNFFSNFNQNSTAGFFLIAGPCVIENHRITLGIATHLKEVTQELDIPFIFKASFDKANRSSIHSFRGPGLDEGLDILADIKKSWISKSSPISICPDRPRPQHRPLMSSRSRPFYAVRPT